jgi:predicted adenine nucleotide alpha hydrolase (AANH) superfamily ATPase
LDYRIDGSQADERSWTLDDEYSLETRERKYDEKRRTSSKSQEVYKKRSGYKRKTKTFDLSLLTSTQLAWKSGSDASISAGCIDTTVASRKYVC